MYFSTLDDFRFYIESSDFKSSEQLMIMAGDRSSAQIPALMELLNKRNISFFGAIFPEIIIGSKTKREGFVVEKLKPVYSALVFPFMMKFSQDINKLKGATAIVFVNGLSGSMKDLTETVYEKLGNSVTYVGGGAGFRDMKQRPCIFNSTGIYKDALYICIVRNSSSVAVEHGWKILRGPFYVNRSYDNVLSVLDNCSAFDVYRHVIEEEEHLTLFREDFFIYAKDHPFGILDEDGTVIVRDPVAVNDDDEIICIAGIPEGSDLYILHGDVDTLLESSMQITRARGRMETRPKRYLPLLFDCLSRAMFLGKYISEELENIQANLSYGVEGALSIGEIACRKNGELVIHNKSTVLALMEL
ncbi:MAG TPA: FIST C-terminal domain-containing protein [Clostridiales bacterium]|nr:FIST C-terminal domain-containing protein [Clostridiales bacterium]